MNRQGEAISLEGLRGGSDEFGMCPSLGVGISRIHDTIWNRLGGERQEKMKEKMKKRRKKRRNGSAISNLRRWKKRVRATSQGHLAVQSAGARSWVGGGDDGSFFQTVMKEEDGEEKRSTGLKK